MGFRPAILLFALILTLLICPCVIAVHDCTSLDPFDGTVSFYDAIPELFVPNLFGQSLTRIGAENYISKICTTDAPDGAKVCGYSTVDTFLVAWYPLDPSDVQHDVFACNAHEIVTILSNPSISQEIFDFLKNTLQLLMDQYNIVCIQDCEQHTSWIEEDNSLSHVQGWASLVDIFYQNLDPSCMDEAQEHACGDICKNVTIPFERFAFLQTRPPETTYTFALNLDGSLYDPSSPFYPTPSTFYPSEHPLVAEIEGTPHSMPLFYWSCHIHLAMVNLTLNGAMYSIDGVEVNIDRAIARDEEFLIATTKIMGSTRSYYDFNRAPSDLTPLGCVPFSKTSPKCGAGVSNYTHACWFPEMDELPSPANQHSLLPSWDPACFTQLITLPYQWNHFNAFSIDLISRPTNGKYCVMYGKENCGEGVVNSDNSPYFFYKCRLHNTEEYTREACASEVTFCPYPVCEFEKKNSFVPSFVKLIKSPKLLYIMPRDVQCFMRDQGIDVIMPIYICKDTLDQSNLPNDSYICDETNSMSGTFSKCCLGFHYGENCNNEPTFSNIKVYPGSLEEHNLILDGATSIPQLFENAGINPIFNNKAEITLPQSLPDYESISGLFTIGWELFGPPSRFTFVYVTPFIIENQSAVQLVPFPLLLARVPATMGYYTFKLDQAEFVNVVNFAQINQERQMDGKISVGFADIQYLQFKLVSTADFSADSPMIEVHFGCLHKCHHGGQCNIETGQCDCFDGYTSGSHCKFTLCDQTVAKYSRQDDEEFASGLEVTDNLNWFVCQFSSFQYLKGTRVENPCQIMNGETIFTPTADAPIDTNKLHVECHCDLSPYSDPQEIPLESTDSKLCNNWNGCVQEYSTKVCQNGGYHPYLFSPRMNKIQACREQCLCPNHFSPEDDCVSCGLKCAHGSSTDDCSRCVCDPVRNFNPSENVPLRVQNWFGASCQCSIVMQVIVDYPAYPSEWDLVKDGFIMSVINDLISDTNIDFKYWFFDDAGMFTLSDQSSQVFRMKFDIVRCEGDDFAGIMNGLSDYYSGREGLLPLSVDNKQDINHLSSTYPNHLSRSIHITPFRSHVSSLNNNHHFWDTLSYNDQIDHNIYSINPKSPDDMNILSATDGKSDLYDLWKNYEQQNRDSQKTPIDPSIPVDNSIPDSYSNTGIAQDYVGGKPTTQEPTYKDCSFLSCPQPKEDNSTAIAVAIAVPIGLVLLFVLFILSLCYCKTHKILFFKPKERKSKKIQTDMSICNSCQHKRGISDKSVKSGQSLTAKSASGSGTTSTALSTTKSVKCTLCNVDFNPEKGIELLSQEARGEEIDDGEELPPGWVKMKSPNGKLFYYHPAEMKTAWKNPLKGEFDQFNSEW